MLLMQYQVNVLGNHIINFSTSTRESSTPLILHILHITVTLGYDVPWRNIHSTLISAANATTHVLIDPLPFVWQTNSTCKKFGDLANGSSWKPDFLPLTVEFKDLKDS
jgi:hypothetical protein